MKKKAILGGIIAILVITVIVESILLGVGYYSRVPKLSNGKEIMVKLADGTKYSVDDIYALVKDKYGLTVLLDKIDGKLLDSKYKDDTTVKAYVETRVATVKANYPDENSLNQFLSYFGCDSIDEYREYLTLEYQKELIGKEFAKTEITDKEIKKYYKDEYVGDIAAKHILVAPENDDTAAAKKLAEEIQGKIADLVKAKTSVADAFEKVAKEYEGNKNVTYQDLGYFNKGAMVSAFEKAVFDLKVGSYSTTPIYTEYGYHLAFVYDQKEKSSLDDAKDTITTKLAEDKYKEKSSQYQAKALKKLRADNGLEIIDSELSEDYSRYVNYMINN